MLTRGLKKDSDVKWIWVDEYVIKQEEVAAAVLPAAIPSPVVEKHHTSENDGRSMLHAPPLSSQNGRLSPLPNDAFPEPINAPGEPSAPQAAPSAGDSAPSAGSDEQFSSEKSEVSHIFPPFFILGLTHFTFSSKTLLMKAASHR